MDEEQTTPEHRSAERPPPWRRPDHLVEELVEEYGTAEQLAALYGAVAQAQGSIPKIPKTKKVTVKGTTKAGKPYNYTFNYAPMEAILTAVQAPMAGAGLAVLFPASRGAAGGEIQMRCILAHKDGGRLVSTFTLGAGGDVKDQGGAMTYAQRYLFTKMLNLAADEDADEMPSTDKGEEQVQAEDRPQKRREAPTPPKKAEPKKKASARAKKQEEAPEEPPPPSDDDAPDAPSGEQEAPNGAEQTPMDDDQKSKLKELCSKLKLSVQKRAEVCQEVTGKGVRELSEADADKLIAHLEGLLDG